MATTFTKIADYTVGSGGAASIDFTSIPSTYTDLCIKYSLRANNTDGNESWDLYLTLNSTSTISTKVLRGNGSVVSSNSLTDRILRAVNPSNWTSNTFSNGELYFPNYTSSANKSWSNDSVTENNATGADMSLTAGLTSISAAIATITLSGVNANFVQYSTATLYGVKNV